MTEQIESLSEKEERCMCGKDDCPFKKYRAEDIKEHIQNTQKRLNEQIKYFNSTKPPRILRKYERWFLGKIKEIFLEEFGDKLI